MEKENKSILTAFFVAMVVVALEYIIKDAPTAFCVFPISFMANLMTFFVVNLIYT